MRSETKKTSQRTIRLGTRSSPLALWQAEYVRDQLIALHPDLNVELVRISTLGDRDRNSPLAAVGGMGLFTKEIQKTLLENSVDIAVHSLKDLPTSQPDGLTLGAIPERESVTDALISPKYLTLINLPQAARVGTSSLRRKAQILNVRPDLLVEPIRGNVETRLNRAVTGDMDAVILATAGLNRLGYTEHVTQELAPPDFLTAVGQGALGVECRSDDTHVLELLEPLNHLPTRSAVLAERHLLRLLEGGCMIPLSAWARTTTDSNSSHRLTLSGRVFSLDGSRMIASEDVDDLAEPEALGKKVAQRLLALGAAEILGTSPTDG